MCMGCMYGEAWKAVFMGLRRMCMKYVWDVYMFSGVSVWLAYRGSA